MTVNSLNALSGSLTLSGFAGSTVGTVALSNGTTNVSVGAAVTSFSGSSKGSVSVRSGNVALSAGDVSAALSAGRMHNLIDYGGDPSGRADSAPALAACISAAIATVHGWTYIPAGTFRLDSPISIAPSLGSDIVILGDSNQVSILAANHTGIGLAIDQTGNGNPYSTVTIKNLFLLAIATTGYSAAALNLNMWGVPQGFPGAPYINLLLEDLRIWGNGSNNSAPGNECFLAGIQLRGSVNSRLNRISWAGPLVSKSPPNSPSTPNVGSGLELTSAVEVHIDSCHFQNGHLAVALLDGANQGIYIRQGTFVGCDYLAANVASSVYNSSIVVTLAAQADAGAEILTLTGLGLNPLDATQPWVGSGMSSPNGKIPGTIQSVDVISNTITLSVGLTTTLPENARVSLQYLGFSGLDLTVVNSEVNPNFGMIQLGYWLSVRLVGNDFTRDGGPESTPSSQVVQLNFNDVTNLTCIGNNFASGAGGDTCIELQYISLNASEYTITGNTFGGYDKIISVGGNVLDVQFMGNATGQSTNASQFSDANSTTRNIILYSDNGVLTSVNPLQIAAPQGLTLPGLPTINPGIGSGQLWNNDGVVSVA